MGGGRRERLYVCPASSFGHTVSTLFSDPSDWLVISSFVFLGSER